MVLQKVLIKQNFINKIIVKDGNEELSNNLKVKLMKMRIKLNKIKKQFDEDCDFMLKQVKEQYKDDNENIEINYNLLLEEKLKEKIDFNDKFTDDEYEEILIVNSNNNVTINGINIDSLTFLEYIYNLLVE